MADRAFASRAVMARNERQRPGYPHAAVERMLVYRGVPHVDEFQRGANGRPILDVRGKKIPIGQPRPRPRGALRPPGK